MKVLMAMLDEEALTPPCENKADLLSEDQPVLNGAEGTCVLTLFRLAQLGIFLRVLGIFHSNLQYQCQSIWSSQGPDCMLKQSFD